MNVICIEEEAFNHLIDKIITQVENKCNKRVQSRWISDKEAVSLLGGISKSTLQRLRNTGKIRYSQPSRKIILYDRDSILDLINQHVQETF